ELERELVDLALAVGQLSLNGGHVERPHLRPRTRGKHEGVRGLVRGVEGALQRPSTSSETIKPSRSRGLEIGNRRRLHEPHLVLDSSDLPSSRIDKEVERSRVEQGKKRRQSA